MLFQDAGNGGIVSNGEIGKLEGPDLHRASTIFDCNIDSLIQCKSALQNELDKLATLHEDKHNLAMQGAILLDQAQNDSLELETEVGKAKEEVAGIKKEETVVTMQLQHMKDGSGMSFWPKPIIHPERPSADETTVIILRPCGFCNGSFHCYDIVVTSCKHTFHPFCLGAMLADSQKCCVCDTSLHPDWWRSFGLRSAFDEMAEFAKTEAHEAAEQGMFQDWIQMAKEGLHSLSNDEFHSDALYTELGSNNTTTPERLQTSASLQQQLRTPPIPSTNSSTSM